MSISLLNRPARHAVERALSEAPPVTARGPACVGLQVKERLWQRMARECEAMMEHALSTGRVVPAEVIDRLDQAVSAPDALAAVAAPGQRDDAPPADTAARSASATQSSRFALLAMAHAGLALAIAPATPRGGAADGR